LGPLLSDRTRVRVRCVGAVVHILDRVPEMSVPLRVRRRLLCQREKSEGTDGDQGLPKVVYALGSLGGAVRHRHATIHTTPCLALASARTLSKRYPGLRRWRERKHPLVTSTQWGIIPTTFSAGGASWATLGLLGGDTSCGALGLLGGETSCATARERVEGSISCATL
jgi:hypothetical protein